MQDPLWQFFHAAGGVFSPLSPCGIELTVHEAISQGLDEELEERNSYFSLRKKLSSTMMHT